MPEQEGIGQACDGAKTKYIIWYQVRSQIADWTQVNVLRGQLETLDQLRLRIELAFEYMQRWSLMLNIQILLLTLWWGVFSKHAY